MASSAYFEGFDQYSIDPEAINPFDFDTSEYLDWEEGFFDALREDYKSYDDRTLDEDWVLDFGYDADDES